MNIGSSWILLAGLLLVELGLPRTPPVGPLELDSSSGRSAFATDQERSTGSAVPCAVPLRWRVAELDPRFGLDRARAGSAVRHASALWEDATGRTLFTHDPGEGFAVDFEFDDRQARMVLRQRLEQELDAADRSLDQRRAALADMNERFELAQAEHTRRANELQQRTEAHNEEVRSWNERGGAPPLELAALQRSAEGLAVERASFLAAEEELGVAHDSIRAETDRLNGDVEDRNRRADALGREFAREAAESGRYDESVETLDGELVSVERRIRIFRFSDQDELVLVIAHELGHALGLGHAAIEGAVMSEIVDSDHFDVPAVRAVDLAMLRARCPRF